MNLTAYLANSPFVMKCFVLCSTVLFKNSLLDSVFYTQFLKYFSQFKLLRKGGGIVKFGFKQVILHGEVLPKNVKILVFYFIFLWSVHDLFLTDF